MPFTEIRVLAEEAVVERLRQVAASEYTDVATLLARVASAIAGQAWRSIPLGPQTREALGVAGRLPNVPDDQLLSDALSDRFNHPR